MKSQLRVVRGSGDAAEDSGSDSEARETSEESSSEDSIDLDHPDLAVNVHYRSETYWLDVDNAKKVVIGIDPGPALCGFSVMAEFRNGADVRRKMLASAIITSRVTDGTPLERVAAFIQLPWAYFVDVYSLGKTCLRIEKQDSRRQATYREDNNHLVGVLAASARQYGIRMINVVSATVKLGKPMLQFCQMPAATTVPRGPRNRLNRKKLGVEVLWTFLTKNQDYMAYTTMRRVKQSQGLFDMCDAALTAISEFKESVLGKRKR